MTNEREPTTSAPSLFGRLCYSCRDRGHYRPCDPELCPVPCSGYVDRGRSASDCRLAYTHVCLSLQDLWARVRSLVLDRPLQSSLAEQRGWLEVSKVPSMSAANESYRHRKGEDRENMTGDLRMFCRLLA